MTLPPRTSPHRRLYGRSTVRISDSVNLTARRVRMRLRSRGGCSAAPPTPLSSSALLDPKRAPPRLRRGRHAMYVRGCAHMQRLHQAAAPASSSRWCGARHAGCACAAPMRRHAPRPPPPPMHGITPLDQQRDSVWLDPKRGSSRCRSWRHAICVCGCAHAATAPCRRPNVRDSVWLDPERGSSRYRGMRHAPCACAAAITLWLYLAASRARMRQRVAHSQRRVLTSCSSMRHAMCVRRCHPTAAAPCCRLSPCAIARGSVQSASRRAVAVDATSYMYACATATTLRLRRAAARAHAR